MLKNFLVLLSLFTITNIAQATVLPVITDVSTIQAQKDQTITITGSGFGSLAAYSGDSNYISFNMSSGWQAGYAPNGNVVGLNISSWTDNQIVVNGFGYAYGWYNWYLTNGDHVTINVFNPQTGSGPAAFTSTVGVANVAAVPEPETYALMTIGLLGLLASRKKIITKQNLSLNFA